MPPRTWLRNAAKFVGCLALAYHLLALTVTNLSTNTALRGQLHTWIRPYVGTLGLWQEWDMFTTIPYYASLRGTVVAEFNDRGTREFAPMLPGLHDAPASLKISSVFSRLMWSRRAFERNVSQWERRVCDAVREAANEAPRSVQLSLAAERLNPLPQVRSSGAISHPEQFKTRPAPCKF